MFLLVSSSLCEAVAASSRELETECSSAVDCDLANGDDLRGRLPEETRFAPERDADAIAVVAGLATTEGIWPNKPGGSAKSAKGSKRCGLETERWDAALGLASGDRLGEPLPQKALGEPLPQKALLAPWRNAAANAASPVAEVAVLP